MLTVVKKYLRFFTQSIKCNFASVLEYKKSFLIQSIFMFVNNIFFLVFWNVVFNAAGGSVNGTTMNDILYLWSIPVIAYGVSFFFFGGTMKLGKYILDGGLDSFLTQPKNVIISVMLSGMEFSAFGDLLYGLVIGLFAVEFNLYKYVILVLLGVLGAIFYICTETIIRLLTILIGNTDNIEHIYINTLLINFGCYPEAIYGKVIKFLIYTVVPSAYIAFVPVKIINSFKLEHLIIFIMAVVIYVVLTTVIAKKLLKRYESGNNIALKS